MPDPRVQEYARLLVGRSIGARPGWQVLVATTTEALPLAEEISRELGRRGAYALTRIHFGGRVPLDAAWAGEAPRELLAALPPLEQQVVDAMDAAIFVLAPADPPADVHLDEPVRRALGGLFLAYRRRGRAREIPEVRCDFPTPFFARQAGLSLAQYEEVFYDACLRDWDAEARKLQPVLERFDAASDVRIEGEETELALSLAGRRGLADDGHQNVPGGEVFYCPVEESVQGRVYFDFPSGAVEGVRLTLREGEVVEWAADAGADVLEQALATDAGARRFGELGLGCNDGITKHLRNVLFDEKMAGTIHLALGSGFPSIGGRNVSAVHWDLVKDMRRGGRIWCDGELVQEDGRWLL